MQMNNTQGVVGESNNVGELMDGAKKVLSGTILTAGSTTVATGLSAGAIGLVGGAVCIAGELIGAPVLSLVSPELVTNATQHLEAIGGYGIVALAAGAFTALAGGVLNAISEKMDKKHNNEVSHDWMDFKGAKKNIMDGIKQMRDAAFGHSENANKNKL